MTPFAFFRAVPLHSSFMLLAVGLVGVAGAVMLMVQPGNGARVCLPVLCVQMFSASTGFAVPARRGHFDLLFTGGASRLRIAGMHLLMSALPGVAIWLGLGALELALSAGASGAALSAGTVLAMVLVSCVAWAVTVPLPRLSGGIGWLLAIVTAAAATDVARALAAAADPRTPALGFATVRLFCPFALIAFPLRHADLWLVVPALTLCAVAVGAAAAWIARTDLALEAAQ